MLFLSLHLLILINKCYCISINLLKLINKCYYIKDILKCNDDLNVLMIQFIIVCN